MVIGFGLSQPLMAKYGGRLVMLIGEGLSAVGFRRLRVDAAPGRDGVTVWSMVPALAIIGLGMGLTMAPFFDIVLAGVDDRESGSASGVLTSVQQLGGAFGIAVLGTVFINSITTSTATSQVGVFRHGASVSMWVAAGLLAVTFALTFLLPKRAREDAAGH